MFRLQLNLNKKEWVHTAVCCFYEFSLVGWAHELCTLRTRSFLACLIFQEQWCDRHGSVAEVRSNLHMKHEGAAKRERAIAYALSHQPRGLRQKGRPSSPANCVRSHDPNGCNQDFSYLDGWMATKPWETRSTERNYSDSQLAKHCEEQNLPASKLSDASSVKIRRNNVTTRVSAAKRPPPSSVLSAASSDSACGDKSPRSRSSVTLTSATTNTVLASEARSDSGDTGGPNYMSLTKSAKARLSGCSGSSHHRSFQRPRSGDMSRVTLSSIDTQSNAGSEISVTSKRLNSMSLNLKGRSLDKENEEDWSIHQRTKQLS